MFVEMSYTSNPLAGDPTKLNLVRGTRMPLLGLFTSSMAEFSEARPGEVLIETPPAVLTDPVVVESRAASNWHQLLPL